ncbi:MAG: cytochrome c biogenesis protein CcsA [Flavobacteriales bacterium]|nr:cytochrome c biogenesis protein CcsA [Flavobacteriales bacterium]
MDSAAIEYIGEHAWAGRLGHLLAIISLAGAMLATLSYFLGAQRRDAAWTTLGRWGFRAHSLAVLGIVLTLFIMLFNHWFEYDYVWKHSNLQMPLKYIASCFWEGQEGSFLLWTFWHMVLGNIVLSRAKDWEPHVMAVIALVQVFLAFMLLGIYVGDARLGSSPFVMLRESAENIGLPWTRMPGYLSAIPQFADGRGLNPLLQNYWMVIHPPTLFLGFAATLVPFAYAIAGLWRNQRSAWIKPALPWTFFGVMVLGTGILMGGAWAYEALSFGGFWAWDPVENASLVPWITLVGAGHLMLVNRRKETSLYATLLLTLITFILVLYSTFLTRSGVLGDTSVHSFTGDGMLPALVRFLLIFIGISAAMLHPDRKQRWFYVIVSLALMGIGIAFAVEVEAILVFGVFTLIQLVQAYRKGFATKEPEEALWSREFWLFIASLILLLSAAQITFSTSIPVTNLLLAPFKGFFTAWGEAWNSGFISKLGERGLAPPSDAIRHYNNWQILFAIVVSLMVAFTQYLRWKDSDLRKFLRQLALSFGIAVVLTTVGVLLLGYRVSELRLSALLFTTVFAAVANIAYIPAVLKGRLRNAGPSIAHAGFALVLLGALVSTSRKQEVSVNHAGMNLSYLNEEFSNRKEILLYRGDTVRMGDHYVSYRGKRKDGVNLHYDMDYFGVAPNVYAEGDTVRVRGMLFRARGAHQADPEFLAQQPEFWEPLEDYTKRELWHARDWSPTRPGEPVFGLSPFVQINPRFGNVAEPSTRHWFTRDLYTHVRYADLSMDPDTLGDGRIVPDDHWMPDRRYDKHVGDTIVTPTSVVIVDSLYTMRDSATRAILGEKFTVHAAALRIRDLYNPDRWFDARPLVIYAGGQPVMGKAAEVGALRVKYELASVDGDALALDVAEHEFVVMQALVFPGINILWIGCVLLALGTGLAVWNRLRAASSQKTKDATSA